MQQAPDDCAKRRLTERIDIITAVDFLHARGYADDDVAPSSPVTITSISTF